MKIIKTLFHPCLFGRFERLSLKNRSSHLKIKSFMIWECNCRLIRKYEKKNICRRRKLFSGVKKEAEQDKSVRERNIFLSPKRRNSWVSKLCRPTIASIRGVFYCALLLLQTAHRGCCQLKLNIFSYPLSLIHTGTESKNKNPFQTHILF